MFKRAYIFSLCTVSALSFSGCSIYNEFYIQNSSANEVWVTVKFTSPWRDVVKDSNTLKLLYVDSVITINRKSKRHLGKKLTYREVNAHKLYIVIPPRSTLLVGGAYNALLFPADSIRINSNGNRFDYSMRSLAPHLQRSRTKIPPHQYIYHVSD